MIMIYLFVYATLAGAMVPLGGLLAAYENIRSSWLRDEVNHAVIAFGGGALLSAVAFVLIPEGEEVLSGFAVVGWIAAGAVVMAIVTAKLAKAGSNNAQLAAMLADFVPEALAFGAACAVGSEGAVLLALMIGLQNLPEGFNAYREQADMGVAKPTILRRFCAIALLGPLAGIFGFFILADFPQITGAIMLAASGAILYLVFQDIAPQSKIENQTSPALGAVAGFLLGLAGHLVIG